VKKIKAIWELTRLDHGIMIVIAIFIGSVITKGLPSINKFLFAILTGIFLEAAAFSLNDYFDLEIDKKNERNDRPLVRGDLKPSTAVLIYAIFLPAGMVASMMINNACFIIALINAIFATLYDIKLKEIKIVGNFYIAFTMAIPFIFGAAAVSKNVPSIIWTIFLIAFLAGAGREIMKDVMDFEGDALKNIKSFPSYFGKEAANLIASIFFILSVALSIIPFFINIDKSYYHDLIYIVIVMIADAILVYISITIIKNVGKDYMSKCRKLTLVAILIGLIAFLIGALV